MKIDIKSVMVGSLLLTSPFAAQAFEAKWVSVVELQTAPGHLSITFDDATRSQFVDGFPVLAQAGFPATLYVNTGVIDEAESFFMTWDEIRLVAKAGWEIGAHTVTHTTLPTMSDVSVVGELVLSRDRITEELQQTPVAFASPYGEFDQRTLAHVERYYHSHVKAWGDNNGINSIDTVDPFLVERVNIDSSLTAEEICGMVDAVTEGEWLVLMFHQISESGVPFTISPRMFQDVVNCIELAVDDGNLSVGTVSAVLKQKGEMNYE